MVGIEKKDNIGGRNEWCKERGGRWGVIIGGKIVHTERERRKGIARPKRAVGEGCKKTKPRNVPNKGDEEMFR